MPATFANFSLAPGFQRIPPRVEQNIGHADDQPARAVASLQNGIQLLRQFRAHGRFVGLSLLRRSTGPAAPPGGIAPHQPALQKVHWQMRSGCSPSLRSPARLQLEHPSLGCVLWLHRTRPESWLLAHSRCQIPPGLLPPGLAPCRIRLAPPAAERYPLALAIVPAHPLNPDVRSPVARRPSSSRRWRAHLRRLHRFAGNCDQRVCGRHCLFDGIAIAVSINSTCTLIAVARVGFGSFGLGKSGARSVLRRIPMATSGSTRLESNL